MLPIEVRYLDIVWSNPETVIKLECSRNALEIKQVPSGWLVETTTFPRIYHYIGFCIKDNSVQHTPYFTLACGDREELMPLKAPGSDDVWWIQSSGWGTKSYLSELFRTAGRADLIIQEQKLTIENNTFNFTVSELEYYLSDFKNSLWMLILNNSSTTKGSVNKEIPDCFNEEVLGFFHEFIQSVEKTVKKPAMTLTESQGKLPLRVVKPVPRTFREYATQPNVKSLTSRTYLESYDTVENRFIHYCIKRVLYVIKSLSRVSETQSRSYAQKIMQEQESLEGFKQAKVEKQVNSRVYDNEITKLTADLEDLTQSFLSGLVSVSNTDIRNQSSGEYGTYSVQVGEAYGNSLVAYFANRLNGDDFKKRYKTYLVIRFPNDVNLSMIHESLKRCDVAISGRYVKEKKFNANNKPYFELKFLDIKSVSIEQHPWQQELSRLTNRREQLERDNWVVSLTKEEQEDRDMEIEIAMRKIELYQSMKQKMSVFSSSLPNLFSRLGKIKNFFSKHGVKTRSDCPNTMVFIQNPSYALAKSQFKRISTLNGLNEFMLNALMAVDDIGLVNIANLYEKWCLLQIIKVLNEVYRFEIENGWQRILVDTVLNNSYNAEVVLQSKERQQKIIITYEKVLESGKRPDFVIDLISKKYEPDDKEPCGYSFPEGEQGEKKNRLVLDAKFRGKISEKEFHKLVSKLYIEKNYSEDGSNQVFILHPSPSVIYDRTSPLIWGSYCDYGQSHEINHQYGGIFIAPSQKHSRSLDNLQRLIGMFLQQKSVILRTDDGNTDWGNMSCLSCGSGIVEFKHKPTKAGSDRWEAKCHFCGLLTIKTICRHCHDPLFKNGQKWTYHRTRAEQTSNVICPKCETFL